MIEENIPVHVRQFLSEHVKSVGHLELLLFLFDGRERAWSADQLILEMRTNDQLAHQQLSHLSSVIKEIDGPPKAYQFNSSDAEILDLVRVLAELYRSRRHAVINEIYAQPVATIQSFADAFVIKK